MASILPPGGIGVGSGVEVGTIVGVGLAVGIAVGVTEGVGVILGVGVTDGVGVAVGVQAEASVSLQASLGVGASAVLLEDTAISADINSNGAINKPTQASTKIDGDSAGLALSAAGGVQSAVAKVKNNETQKIKKIVFGNNFIDRKFSQKN